MIVECIHAIMRIQLRTKAIQVLWYISVYMLFVTKFQLDTRIMPPAEKYNDILWHMYIYIYNLIYLDT